MKRDEQDQLLKELLTGEELTEIRRTSLERSLLTLRRRRQYRHVARLAVFAPLPLLLALGILLMRPPKPSVRQIASSGSLSAEVSQPAGVKYITDEELFALFPDRPLALIGKPGQQELVFLDILVALTSRDE